MTRLLVGCPVRSREWIMHPWFMAVEKSAVAAGVDLSYVFVLAKDDPTRAVIETFRDNVDAEVHLVDSGEWRARDEREWNPGRYRHMVQLRNLLLTNVRALEPDYFLSLDSDILLAEPTIANLIESADRFDAVGGRAYMSAHGTQGVVTRIDQVNSAGWYRDDTDLVVATDVIMAIKLMGPQAYQVDYNFDARGEDIGWSNAVRMAGLTLGFDGRAINKHVFLRGQLTAFDPRCGW